MGKSLIVYYSMDGNTRQIAERIQAETGFPLIQLETTKPYTGTDAEIVAQGQEEVNRGYQPPLKPLGVDLEAYDTFLVGTPTWWYTLSSPILSFLHLVDWQGKTLVPFQTHAGWPGHCLEDMARVCRGAEVRYPKKIRFSPQQFGKLVTPQGEVGAWIAELKTL